MKNFVIFLLFLVISIFHLCDINSMIRNNKVGDIESQSTQIDFNAHYKPFESTLILNDLNIDIDWIRVKNADLLSFINQKGVKNLLLENNKFSSIPVELIKLLIEAPDLIYISIKGSLCDTEEITKQLTRGSANAGIIEAIPEIVSEFSDIIQQSINTVNDQEYQTSLVKKVLYLAQNMPPVEIIQALKKPDTACTKFKNVMIKICIALIPLLLTHGTELLSLYFTGKLDSPSTDLALNCTP